MRYCEKCNASLEQDATFCPNCGVSLPENDLEQEFLDTTHRLLRWERKAWSITSKFMLIFGIISSALLLFCAFLVFAVTVGSDVPEASFIVGFYAGYGIFLGVMLIAVGIVGRINTKKIAFYLDTMHSDFRATEKRVGSVGMIVVNAIFNSIGLIFCIINFIRIKQNKERIQKIYSRQNIEG